VANDRGNMSRPGVAKVYDYRHYVTNEIKELLESKISLEVEHLLLIEIHHRNNTKNFLLQILNTFLVTIFVPKYNGIFPEEKLKV
jgi:hypothetical protein